MCDGYFVRRAGRRGLELGVELDGVEGHDLLHLAVVGSESAGVLDAMGF